MYDILDEVLTYLLTDCKQKLLLNTINVTICSNKTILPSQNKILKYSINNLDQSTQLT